MALNFTKIDDPDLSPRISVFGVGGAGGNAVNNMIAKKLEGVEFVVANTDAQALAQSQSERRIQLGSKVTEGLGAGAKASIGAAAAEESIDHIIDHLSGSHMCFITAGMGGGTGTGAAPIIAQAARELGILTVGVVTKPFQFEGARRMRQAEDGVEALQKMVDTLIIIPNQNLFRLANEKTTFTEAFALADDVLYQGVKGVTDLMVRPGLINLDFADVRAVMDEMGKAMMGTGEATGEERAIQAAEKAIANPLLDEISLRGARGVLINITGSMDLTLFELDEAANRIREEVDPEANIIVGSTLDPEMSGTMRVSVVATGIDAVARSESEPLPRRRMADVSEKAPAQTEPLDSPQAETSFLHDVPHEPQPAQEAPVEVVRSEAQSFDQDANESLLGQQDFEQRNAPPVDTQYTEASTPNPKPQLAEVEHIPTPFDPLANKPTQETIDRVRAAAQARRDSAPRHEATSAPSKTSPEPRGARMGIGSLIGRMTGQQDAEKPSSSNGLRVDVTQETDTHQSQRSVSTDIPAFLRRQAN